MMLRLTAERREDAARASVCGAGGNAGRTRMLTRRRRPFRGGRGARRPCAHRPGRTRPFGQSGPLRMPIGDNRRSSVKAAGRHESGGVDTARCRLATVGAESVPFGSGLMCRAFAARVERSRPQSGACAARPAVRSRRSGTRDRNAPAFAAYAPPGIARVAGHAHTRRRAAPCQNSRPSSRRPGAASFRFVRSQGLPCRHCSGLV